MCWSFPRRCRARARPRRSRGPLPWPTSLQPPMDVLVVTRGGGSIEDLWCFNEEPVVRAIFASRVPVVSAIGHEIDVTLSDLVADVRALTPTEAAQRVVPATDEIAAMLQHRLVRLQSALGTRASSARATARRVGGSARASPATGTHPRPASVGWTNGSCVLNAAIQQSLRDARQQLLARSSQLESLSPLGVLARGYSLTQREMDGALGRPRGHAAELAIAFRPATRRA